MSILTVPIDIYGCWHISIFIALFVCAFLILRCYWGSMERWALALTAWVLIRGLMIVEFPALPFGDYTRAFQATAGQTLLEFILIVLAVLAAPSFFWSLLPYLVATEIGLLWGFGAGLMKAPSFDTALIALCVPLVAPWLAALSVITIIANHGSTALLILGSQFAMIALRRRGPMRSLFFMVIAPALTFTAYLHHYGPLLDGLERIHSWERYMGAWAASGWRYVVFGVGPGSFMFHSLLIDNYKPPFFLMMHSDWLQIPFELGLVGLILTLGVLYKALQGAWCCDRLAAAVIGAAAFGLTYHPMRFAPSAIVITMIIVTALAHHETE